MTPRLASAKHLVAVFFALLPLGCAPAQPTPTLGPVGAAHVAARESAASEAKVRAERLAVAFGDVHELARLLEGALLDGSRGTGPVRAVLVDERTGELVVFGTEDGIARVKAILSPAVLETEGGDVDVIALAHAGADDLLRLVAPLCDRRVRLVADASINALVVSGDAAARACVKKTVAALDVEPTKRSDAGSPK